VPGAYDPGRQDPAGCSIDNASASRVGAVLALWSTDASFPSITDSHTALTALLAHDPGALLVAEVEGELVGSVIAAWNGWRGSLYRLVVATRHRRLGVGSRLVDAAERRLLARGASRVDALVDAGDPSAIAFWEAIGYRRRRQDQARFVRDFGPSP
jgi:ribosomal protein S18 acetylase RimI-like enzyme